MRIFPKALDRIIDLDTGREVPYVRWLDTEQSVLEALVLGPDGNIETDSEGNQKLYWAKGRFRLVGGKIYSPPKTHLIMGAPRCTKCGRTITLRGNDLCAFCHAINKGIKGFKVERYENLLVRCQHKEGTSAQCTSYAQYGVSDEVTGTPAVVKNYLGFGKTVLFDQATMVRQRWYCASHYVPPRLLDANGEVMTVFQETAGRPE
jgi:hypothetical protein